MVDIVEVSSPPSSPEFESLARTSEELRKELDECLSNIQSDGSFALFEHLSNPPNPGIYLKNGELIGLPLSNRDAQVIVAASHAAPFGKGEETLVDENPFLESIVAKVSAGLGVDATGKGVSAELYKMLLYDEGAMFKPHQDSEKAPRMFATLVIALPSKHQGGEVRVTHGGKTKTFETSRFSEFDSSYLAWFADVTHEVKPVLAGHRLVLTYNLIHTTLGSKELAARSDNPMSKLRWSLSQWRENLGTDRLPTKLAFLLEHQYTDASLCYDGLKGHDQQVAAHLREACRELGFCFYLANFERRIYGGCDEDGGGYGDWDDCDGDAGDFHEITEECDRSTSLKKVVDLDGTEVDNDLNFDEEHFIQADPFENKAPDAEDYSGFTGNEGVCATHFYHRTVALIIPRRHHMEFFLSYAKEGRRSYLSFSTRDETDKEKVIQWIDRLTAKLGKDSADDVVREDLLQICQTVIRKTQKFKTAPEPKYRWHTKPAPFSEEAIARVVTLSVELNDEKMFLDAYDIYSKKVAIETFDSVGVALLRYRLQSLLPKLSTSLSALNTLSERLEILDNIRHGLDNEWERTPFPDTPYRDWLSAEVFLALSPSVAMKSERDGTGLVDIARRFPPQGIFIRVLPAVKRNIDKTPMVVAFLAGLADPELDELIPDDVANTIFRDVVADLADSSFSLHSLGLELVERNEKAAPLRHFARLVAIPAPAIDERNSRNIEALLYACQELGLVAELNQIVKKLVAETKTAELDLFHGVYLPLLKLLVKRFSEKVPAGGSPFQTLFRQILCQYILRYVQPEPTPPKDWKESAVSCACQDCQSLNRFLASPTEKVGRFAVAKKRREHLQSVLNGARSGCKHETDRRGSPQTLVVTKMRAQYQAVRRVWVQRCDVAKKHLEELGAETLKGFLGDMYGPIMFLSAGQPQLMTLNALSSAQMAALAANGNASNRVLEPPTRRKVPSNVQPEVIVIDDSE